VDLLASNLRLLDLLCRGINHGSVLKIFEVFIPVTVSCIPWA
jgi:hypothetical protein